MVSAVVWQKIEGAALFLAGLVLFWHVNVSLSWWLALLLFFAPDVSFVAYMLGPKAGALGYNLVHVYAFGGALFAAGLVLSIPLLAALGALWLAHSGFDRMLGYGLKLPDSFSSTHLGRIGKNK